MSQLLQGIRVLDLTRLLPGPLCTMHLADQGAEVIKIEDKGKGDYTRTEMVFGMSMSHLFHALNRGKKSVALDLKDDDDREAFLRLVDTADVVVESFRPGVMDKLGVGHSTLRERKPSLIVCALTAYGQDGPRKNEPAHDNNMLALAGVADQFPREDGTARSPNYQIADVAGGSLTALSAIAMALVRRERTGEGATIDISMTEGALSSAVNVFSGRQTTGKAIEANQDVLTGLLPCYDYYATKDGRQIAVGALEPKFWMAFCNAAERPDLIAKGHVVGPEGKAAKQDVADFIRSKTFEEWTELLEGMQACVTPVKTLDETIEDPHIEARGMFFMAEDPVDGPLLRMASPFVIDGERVKPMDPAPRQGEHTDQYLGQELNVK